MGCMRGRLVVRRWQGWGFATAVVLAPFAAASAEVAGETAALAPAVSLGTSSSGNYLAARHAGTHHDFPTAADLIVAALETSIEDVQLLQRAHFLFVLEGRLQAANELARRLTGLAEGQSFANLSLAVEALRRGEAAFAREHLDAVPETSFYRVLKPLLRAWILVQAEQFGEALDALEAIADREGARGIYLLHAAMVNEVKGDMAAAAELYRQAIAGEDPLSVRTAVIATAFFQRQSQFQDATAVGERYLDQAAGSRLLRPVPADLDREAMPGGRVGTAVDGAAEALLGVAGALSQQRAGEMALGMAQLGLALRPDFPELQLLAAQLMESFTRYEAANRMYRSIDAASPLAWQARLGTAANLDRLDDLEAAEALLLDLSRERPTDAAPLVELGDILRRRDRFAEAVEAYDQAFLRLQGTETRDWSLYYTRGIALERSKQWSRAEADFLKALELQPDQPYVLNYLGYSWVDQGTNLEQALEMIEKAVELRPTDGYIVDSLGWAYYKLGDFDAAVRELERAVELRPGDPVINDHLGDAYWSVGRHREARFQWRAALGFDPEPDVRAEIERKLREGLVTKADTKSDG